MRTLRTLIGVILVGIGVPALVLAGSGWLIQRHAEASGSFAAQLSPVHSQGYAVSVPDVAALLDRRYVPEPVMIPTRMARDRNARAGRC